MTPHKTYFNWSTGKDAALALYYLMQNEQYEVAHLLTAINAHFDRVSMHGLRRSLMEQQIQSIGLPSSTIELPEQPSMEVYEKKMQDEVERLYDLGFRHAAFGDIFLEDLRAYREKQLQQLKMQSCFPLWKKDTRALLDTFLDLGFKAITVCVKAELLSSDFVGREIDRDFIRDLPDSVDPCGEHGEFHTFCYDGPIFQNPISFTVGEKIYKAYEAPKQDEMHDNDQQMGFWFCDLLPEK